MLYHEDLERINNCVGLNSISLTLDLKKKQTHTSCIKNNLIVSNHTYLCCKTHYLSETELYHQILNKNAPLKKDPDRCG